MGQVIRGLSIAAIVLFGLFLLMWCALTEFGTKRGVVIEQTVKSHRLIDSTYYVDTYVWNTHALLGFMVNGSSIEWSSYKTVKCYDVEKEKQYQMMAAIAAKKQIEDFKKRGLRCDPK